MRGKSDTDIQILLPEGGVSGESGHIQGDHCIGNYTTIDNFSHGTFS